ncbi:RNA-directed DNA polymerase, eukaryota, reverse transcriptase zinc-binding domain protein, partial [Tanacetum coccineum]
MERILCNFGGFVTRAKKYLVTGIFHKNRKMLQLSAVSKRKGIIALDGNVECPQGSTDTTGRKTLRREPKYVGRESVNLSEAVRPLGRIGTLDSSCRLVTSRILWSGHNNGPMGKMVDVEVMNSKGRGFSVMGKLLSSGFDSSVEMMGTERVSNLQFGHTTGTKNAINSMESLHFSVQRVVDAGLRINIHKSKIMGISVSNDKVTQAAVKIGCASFKTPFWYLGTKVGGAMCRIKSWEEIVSKFKSRLSKWKMKTLSIGGRMTLIKSVLSSLPIYHMSIYKDPKKIINSLESIRSHFFNGVDHLSKKPIWIKWKKVLALIDKGGLGISSFYALNRALLFKWIWLFYMQDLSLWAKLDIVKGIDSLNQQGMNFVGYIHKKMGNGLHTYFWDDIWKGDTALKILYPRIYALETNKNIFVASKLGQNNLGLSLRRIPRGGVEQSQLKALREFSDNTVLVDSMDRWSWSLDGLRKFSVASVRIKIDKNLLLMVSSKTRWVNEVTKKVNIHAWKVKLDCLPIRLNISRRGISINSILCPNCDKEVESSSHIFFSCQFAREIFARITSWWEVPFSEISSYDEWFLWLMNLRLPLLNKQMLEGVCYTMWWNIWSFRNKNIFGLDPPKKEMIFDDI